MRRGGMDKQMLRIPFLDKPAVLNTSNSLPLMTRSTVVFCWFFLRVWEKF